MTRAIVPASCLALAAALAGCGNDRIAQEPVRPVITQTVVPGGNASRDV